MFHRRLGRGTSPRSRNEIPGQSAADHPRPQLHKEGCEVGQVAPVAATFAVREWAEKWLTDTYGPTIVGWTPCAICMGVEELGPLPSGLAYLLYQAEQSDPTTRIEFRDPIAAYGSAAIQGVRDWLQSETLGSFALRVVRRAWPHDPELARSVIRDATIQAPAAVRADAEAMLAASDPSVLRWPAEPAGRRTVTFSGDFPFPWRRLAASTADVSALRRLPTADAVDVIVVGWDCSEVSHLVTQIRQPTHPPRYLPQEGWLDLVLTGNNWWTGDATSLNRMADEGHPIGTIRDAWPTEFAWPSIEVASEVPTGDGLGVRPSEEIYAPSHRLPDHRPQPRRSMAHPDHSSGSFARSRGRRPDHRLEHPQPQAAERRSVAVLVRNHRVGVRPRAAEAQVLPIDVIRLLVAGNGAVEVQTRRKLIEVALPLEAINVASAREKSIRHGHPSTLHLWWARRPLAACRAVLFASLVDDPSSDPDRFPTPKAVEDERTRLFGIIERLVLWENTTNEAVLEEARAEIRRSTGGNPPPLLDPFCGGGSIPLEAQRLGLTAYASDLNPVAVLITKALIEIPPKFANRPPVHPDARRGVGGTGAWKGAAGLAEDIRRYGAWMRDEAERRIGHLYPKVRLSKELSASEATVIAWLWARTVTCPNPACGARMPPRSLLRPVDKEGQGESGLSPSNRPKCQDRELRDAVGPRGRAPDGNGRATRRPMPRL